MNEIQNVASKIKGRKCAGSSITNGVLYHDLPFEEFGHLRSHRSNTLGRFNKIKSKVDFSQKTVIDLGCSVGGLSLLAAQEGAKMVIGYDYDQDSINVARAASTALKLNNTSFIAKRMEPAFIAGLPEVDITLWLSNWMWMVKQHGMGAAKKMLYNVSMKSKILVFESAANDGMARINNATQADIEKWVRESTCYSKIENLGPCAGWKPRNILVCINQKMKIPEIINENNKEMPRVIERGPTWRGYTATVKRAVNNLVKKTYKSKFKWMVEREVECLRRLEKYPNFPRCVEFGDDFLYLTYCGVRANAKDFPDQKKAILKALEEQKIVHRDINPKNLFTLNGILYLIDFGWAIYDDEKETPVVPPSQLGGGFYKNRVWNDAAALEKC